MKANKSNKIDGMNREYACRNYISREAIHVFDKEQKGISPTSGQSNLSRGNKTLYQHLQTNNHQFTMLNSKAYSNRNSTKTEQ